MGCAGLRKMRHGNVKMHRRGDKIDEARRSRAGAQALEYDAGTVDERFKYNLSASRKELKCYSNARKESPWNT
jgi:hypothetical protein